MRALLKKGGEYLTLYRIVLTRNSIVGWHTTNAWFNTYVKIGTNHDIHFTYPLDGNYHISYKYFDNNEDVFIEKRVYYDTIIVKRFEKDTKKFLGFQKARRVDDFDDPTTLMFQEQAPKLTTKPFRFGFSVIVLPHLSDNRLIKLFNNKELVTQPKPNDLILDVNNYPGKIVNIGSLAVDKDDNEKIVSDKFDRLYRREENEHIAIELYALIIH